MTQIGKNTECTYVNNGNMCFEVKIQVNFIKQKYLDLDLNFKNKTKRNICYRPKIKRLIVNKINKKAKLVVEK